MRSRRGWRQQASSASRSTQTRCVSPGRSWSPAARWAQSWQPGLGWWGAGRPSGARCGHAAGQAGTRCGLPPEAPALPGPATPAPPRLPPQPFTSFDSFWTAHCGLPYPPSPPLPLPAALPAVPAACTGCALGELGIMTPEEEMSNAQLEYHVRGCTLCCDACLPACVPLVGPGARPAPPCSPRAASPARAAPPRPAPPAVAARVCGRAPPAGRVCARRPAARVCGGPRQGRPRVYQPAQPSHPLRRDLAAPHPLRGQAPGAGVGAVRGQGGARRRGGCRGTRRAQRRLHGLQACGGLTVCRPRPRPRPRRRSGDACTSVSDFLRQLGYRE